MRKTSTLMLSVMLCFGMCFNASAQDTTETDNGEIDQTTVETTNDVLTDDANQEMDIEISVDTKKTTEETQEGSTVEGEKTQPNDQTVLTFEDEQTQKDIETTQDVAPSSLSVVPMSVEPAQAQTNSIEPKDDGIDTYNELLTALEDSTQDVVTISGDIQLEGSLYIDRPVTLNLGGFTLTGSSTAASSNADNNVINIISEGVAIKGGTIKATNASRNVVVTDGHSFKIEGTTLDHTDGGAGAPIILNGKNDINVTLTDVKLVTGTNSWYAMDLDTRNANAIVLNMSNVSLEGDKPFLFAEKTETGKPNITVTSDGQSLYYLVDTNSGNGCVVGQAVVSVGDDHYLSLEEAVNQASEGSTINVLQDTSIDGPITTSKTLTINGNDKSISANYSGTSGNQTMFTSTANTLTINNVTLSGSPKYGVQAYENGTVKLDGVTIDNPGYGGVLLNGGKGDLNNVTVNGDVTAVEMAKGSGVTKYPSLTLKNKVNGTNKGLYIDNSQFDTTSAQYKAMVDGVKQIGESTDMIVFDKDGVLTADDALESVLENPADKITVADGWYEYDDTQAHPSEGREIDGYRTVVLDSKVANGYVNKNYTNAITENGTSVSVKVYLDPAEYANGELFQLSVALNDNADQYAAEYSFMTQKVGDGFVANSTEFTNEAGVYTYTWTFVKTDTGLMCLVTISDEDGATLYETYLTDTIASNPETATSIRYVWAFGRDINGTYTFDQDLILCTDKVVSEPVHETNESKTENAVSTWDDGGPFTTDAAGNVYDRWGNEIWHNPVSPSTGKPVSGFHLVNTSDR